MADVDIAVDSGDLKAAIQMLNDYGMAFTKMVNQAQTDSNRLERASKATSDQVRQAFDNMVRSAETNRITETTKKQEAALKQYGNAFKNILGENTKAAREEAKQVADATKQQENTLKQFGSTFKGILGENARVAKETSQQIIAAKKQEADAYKAFGGTFQNLIREQNAAAAAQVQALQQQGQAFKELIAEKERLTKAYNPLLAAEQQFLKMQNEIKRAGDIGVITAKQQAAALDQLQTEFDALGKGVYVAGSRFNQFGEMSGVAGKSASRFGMYAQQAGYQVGDFAVQLQSGTNAGVAFSQQAAQLAGLIPGLAGAITTFAAIGIGLWIQNVVKAGEEGKKTGKLFEDLGSTLDNLEAIRLDNIGAELTSHAEKAKEQFVAILGIMEQIEAKSLKATLDQPLEGFRKQFANYEGLAGVAAQTGAEAPDFSVMGFKTIEAAALAYTTLRDVQGESREELAKSLEVQTQLLIGSGLMNAEMQNIVNTMAEQIGVTEIIKKNIDDQGASAAKIDEYYQNALQTSLAQSYELSRQNELEATKAKYGAESLQYLDAQKEAALETYRIELVKAGIFGEQQNYLVSLKEEYIEMEQAAARNKLTLDQMLAVLERISGIDISGVFTRAQGAAAGLLATVNAVGRGMAQLGKLGVEAAALKAQSDALAGGASPGEARVKGDVVKYGYELPQGGGFMGDALRGIMSKAYEANAMKNLEYNEEIASGNKAWNDANKSGGGGGKKKGGKGKKTDAEKASEKLNDFLDQFEINMEQQERLSGVFGEQREELEKVIEIEGRLGDARHLASDQQIQAWAEQELALERKLEAEQELFNIGRDNFKSFLDDVISGTGSIEDAFRSMLSNMIKDLYDQYVAKHAADQVGSWISTLFSANGNAFNGAGQVQYFANGGIVSSPTAFKHSGGLGVAGEAGPEGILPLKRNAQGKLGVQVAGGSGSGDVHIVQHFSMSANGDESVRQIIKQQMPAIEARTTQAVIAAKRRGQKGL